MIGMEDDTVLSIMRELTKTQEGTEMVTGIVVRSQTRNNLRRFWTLHNMRLDDDGNRNGDEFMLGVPGCGERLVLWTPYGMMTPGTCEALRYACAYGE